MSTSDRDAAIVEVQRLIARDKDCMTAMKTWEIYLAPSITQRKIFKFASRFDGKYFP